MTNTWWVGEGDLDEDQKKVIALGVDQSALVTGPPGSGKTNLLLLRANLLHLSGLANILIVTFTRSLREFIANGANNYAFPSDKIKTSREWQFDMIRQYGGDRLTSTNDFEADRILYHDAIAKLAKKNSLSNDTYDSILLDEAQDYSPEEISLFASLTKRLFCVADERQKIYEGKDNVDTIKQLVKKTESLKYHYRNGLKICKVADEIAKKMNDHLPLADTSNYSETKNPSTVDVIRCKSLDEQIKKTLERIPIQSASFPGELIGILCPKNHSLDAIWKAVSESIHGRNAVLMHGSSDDYDMTGKTIVISTIHGAKGLEFRALHLLSCEEFRKFGQNRRMAFTAVTRAKTALSVYHSEPIHGYFEAALTSINPRPSPPELKDLFKGKR